MPFYWFDDHDQKVYNDHREENIDALNNLHLYPNFAIHHAYFCKLTLLHKAALMDDHEMAAACLLHPDVNVNAKEDNMGATPLYLACYAKEGNAVVRALLEHPSIRADEGEYHGYTPLYTAFTGWRTDIIKSLLASGSVTQLDTHLLNALWICHGNSSSLRREIYDLLRDFNEDPDRVRTKLRLELRYRDEWVAADIFILVVCLCDNFFEIRSSQQKNTQTRFFTIARQLPLELQMLLCRRVSSSMKDMISGKAIKRAIGDIAKKLAASTADTKKEN